MANRGGKIQRIKERIYEILEDEAKTMRYADLGHKVISSFGNDPGIKRSTVWTTLAGIVNDPAYSKKIIKVDRGLFRAADTDETKEEMATTEGQQIDNTVQSQQPQKVSEDDFYESFARWLVEETEDCTKAIPLGGNIFREKWGTPDVLGIKKPTVGDIVQFQIEVTSAEIKLDPNNLITAFGQACAYRLFSNKTYLVIPKNSPEEDEFRIESLCQIYGLGLVLFDSNNPNDPGFEIRTRPQRFDPDMYYVNHYLGQKLVKDKLFK